LEYLRNYKERRQSLYRIK